MKKKRTVFGITLAVLILAVVTVVITLTLTERGVRHELYLGVVGSFDETAQAQIKTGRFWIDNTEVPYGVSIPLRSAPGMRFDYRVAGLPIVELTPVDKAANRDQLIEQLAPGARRIGEGRYHQLYSQGRRPEPVRFEVWECLLELADGRLDSCCLIAVTGAHADERCAFIYRVERNGRTFLPPLEDLEARVVIEGGSFFSRAVDGHALMFQVNTLQDESALPSAYRGREWYDPSADKK